MKIFYFYELGSWKYLRKTNKFQQKKENTINMLVRIPQYSQKLVEQKKIKEETNKKKKKRK